MKALAARRMHGEEGRYKGGPLLDSGRFVTTAPAACGMSQNKVSGVVKASTPIATSKGHCDPQVSIRLTSQGSSCVQRAVTAPLRTYLTVVLSKRGPPSPSTSHAHRPRRPVLSPSRVPIALPLERGILADLAVAAALPLMHIRTIRVRRLPLPLRRRSPAVAHSGIQRRRPRALDMAHGRLFGPGLAGVGVCVDVRDDGSGGAGGVGGGVFGGGGRVGGLGGDLGAVGGGGGDVAVAFEDFFGSDVGGVVEEGGVAEDGLEVFGDLLGGGHVSRCRWG